MKVTPTVLPDVFAIEPEIYGDDRGFFYESFNRQEWQKATGLPGIFVQSNHSRSLQGVLRGIHYQIKQPQGKLVRVVVGEVFDVAIDLRRHSPTFGQWVGEYLSAENKKQLWVPEGFGHAFLVLSEVAEVLYKTTDYYAPRHERCIAWNDPDIAVSWPFAGEVILSAKDSSGLFFKNAELYD